MSDRVDLAQPSIAEMSAMKQEERIALLAQLDALADEVAQARGALHALLHEPPSPPKLIDANEAARQLGVSVDTVRAKGTDWGIEVYLGDGLYRYDPLKVEALRQRRRPRPTDPLQARLKELA